MALPDKPWPTGLVEQLEPLVGRLLAPNPSPFTYTGTQTYLVGDDKALVVIDPGPAEPDHLEALERAVGGAQVLAIACTHTHRDHSPAAAPLAARTGAPVVGCAQLTTFDTATPGEVRSDAPFDLDYAPDRVLADGEVIEGRGWSLRAIATPGHTSNHLCFALEDADGPTGAVFTGDHVMGWSTTVVSPPDGDMGDYMASLERLRARADRVFYPAHGPAVERPAQLLRGMMGHRMQRERQILKLLEETEYSPAQAAASGDMSGADGMRSLPAHGLTIGEMVPQMYRAVDRKLWPAAGQSVLAHLIELERRGRVVRSGDVWTTTA